MISAAQLARLAELETEKAEKKRKRQEYDKKRRDAMTPEQKEAKKVKERERAKKRKDAKDSENARLLSENARLFSENERVKAEMETYRSFYKENSHLRLPRINDENLIRFEEFLVELLQNIEDISGSNAFICLCEYIYSRGVLREKLTAPPPTLITYKLHELTGEKNLKACEHYLLTRLGVLAVENVIWECSPETIVDYLLEGL